PRGSGSCRLLLGEGGDGTPQVSQDRAHLPPLVRCESRSDVVEQPEELAAEVGQGAQLVLEGEQPVLVVVSWRWRLDRRLHRQVGIAAKALDRSAHLVVCELAGTGGELRLLSAITETRDLDRVLGR